MGFQSAINQALGTVGLAARMSPGYDKKQQIYDLKKKQQLLAQKGRVFEQSEAEATLSDIEAMADLASQEADVAKQMWDLNPSETTYAEMQSTKKQQRMMSAYSSELLTRQEMAMARAEELYAAKTAQKQKRRNFMDYLKLQETSLGGTVGDLPANMQKEIAKTYTKSQRKSMMDRMDREAKDGK